MHRLRQFNDHTGLLVSVRNAAEAQVALAGGADVIDVKEPTRGSLGAADPDVVAAVVTAVGERVPISVAAGELLEGENMLNDLVGIAYAKIGLAGCRPLADWPARWRYTIALLPRHVQPVAVAYADWQLADAPPPADVLAEAAAVGCPALLVDTWDKSAGTLFDHWPAPDVAGFCRRVRGVGLDVVLAGSLSGERLITAARCRPSLVAVRGAVCIGGRTGPLSATRVRAVRVAVRSATPHARVT
jgi:uncharacterized protein (UPF0264 family)